MSLCWLAFFILAAFEWSLTWIACAIDSMFGDRTISPPPLGYFAIRTAGGIPSVAALIGALVFSMRSVNAPLRHWLDGAGILRMVIALCIAAAILLGSRLKTRTDQTSAREIYGSPRKAAGYRLGICIVLLTVLLAIAKRHSV